MDGFCMLLLFFLLLPYTISLLFGEINDKEEKMERSQTAEYKIICETTAGVEYIDLEEYLIGTMAASIDAKYEVEMLKAQAIILRTVCRKAIQNNSENGNEMLEKELELTHLTENEMIVLWGDDYEENREKIEEAVEETKGFVITYEEKLIEAGFFQMSNGTTRDGSEILGDEYVYLQPVICEDVESTENFTNKMSMSKTEFINYLEGIVGESGQDEMIEESDQEVILEEANQEQITLILDSSNYVKEVIIGETKVSGEYFRKELGIISSCFQLQEVDGDIVITTKGIGHGIGVDQYQGNIMAKNGNTYREILSYFYQGIEIVNNV